MSREEQPRAERVRKRTPEDDKARSKEWKAKLRSTPAGEAEYQEMCARAVDAAERLATRRSA